MIIYVLIAIGFGAIIGVLEYALEFWVMEQHSKQRKRDIMKDCRAGYLND